MAVAVRPVRRALTALPAPIERAGFAAWPLLAALVSLNAVARTALGWLRETPIYLGDEYLYAELGRSIAETGKPLVRGAASDFPALFQPLITAPAWLFSDVGTSFHVVQAMGALAMSLAAIPAFWLARRLGLSKGIAFTVAALALALPDLIYAGWVIAEPFAYPLVLGAVAAAVAALAQPSRKAQLLFVALALLAAFTRIQFVVLPACFFGAVLLIGLRERRLRSAVREQLLPLGLLAVPIAIALALGPSRVLAFYGGVVDTELDVGALLGNSARNLFVLAFASGFVLVPGALLGLGLAVVRPRSRAELAFAVLTLLLTVGLLGEAGSLGAAELAQERYLFYVLPLAVVGFCLYASRGWPLRLYHALIAATLVTTAAVVPLSGYAAANEKMHSTLLFAVFRVEQWAGSPGSGSLLVALTATLATVVVVLCSRVPRVATVAALGVSFAICAGFSASAVVFDLENTSAARKSFFDRDPSWVDNSGLGDVTLLRNVGGQRGPAFQQLFWNRSVNRVVLMPGATPIDPFSADAVRIGRDGSLHAGGVALDGPLLVDQHVVTVQLSGAKEIATAPGYSLFEPTGTPRLSMFFAGRHHDGWLGGEGAISLWPRGDTNRLEGTFFIDLVAPQGSEGAPIRFRLPDGQNVEVRVPSRAALRVRLPVCSRGPWTAAFGAQVTGYVGTRAVSVRGRAFEFLPWRGACAGRPEHGPAPVRAAAAQTV